MFANIKEGDKLYIVYQDTKHDYQIGEAVVTGFHKWTYKDTDRFEDITYGEYPQTNILYKFKDIDFSRNLEYCLDDTHFTDAVKYGYDYTKMFASKYITTFTTYDEAKEYIINTLSKLILNKQQEIKTREEQIKTYKANLSQFK